MRGQQARHLSEDREQCGGRARPGQKRTTELPQEQHQRHLARLVGQLPVPGAGRIGAAKGELHFQTQAQRIDLETLRQIRLKRLGHAQDRGSPIGGRDGDNRRKRAFGRKRGVMGHRETPE